MSAGGRNGYLSICGTPNAYSEDYEPEQLRQESISQEEWLPDEEVHTAQENQRYSELSHQPSSTLESDD